MGKAGGPRPIALWAVPRSASTAFERMAIERGDLEVLDEPFSAAYYHGPEQVSRRYPVTMADATYDQVLAGVEAAGDGGPVFLKDMAYHVAPVLSRELLGRFTNSFLIRDPRWSIPSMHKVWPDLTLEEVGFHRLEEAFDLARAVDGTTPPVIDAHELLANPVGVIGRWCAAVGLDPQPGSLAWEPGMQPQWELWPDWYQGTAASSGFGPPPAEDPPPVHDDDVVELIAACLPVYERLCRHRLHA
jgi:hypothetical protein